MWALGGTYNRVVYNELFVKKRCQKDKECYNGTNKLVLKNILTILSLIVY